MDFNSLKLKHTYNITKDEILKEYGRVVSGIEPLAEYPADYFSADFFDINIFNVNSLPTRLQIYISPAFCKMKLSAPDKPARILNPLIARSTECSSSDSDEATLGMVLDSWFSL